MYQKNQEKQLSSKSALPSRALNVGKAQTTVTEKFHFYLIPFKLITTK